MKEPREEIICVCFGITDREIEKAVRDNKLTTVEQATNCTKAGNRSPGAGPSIIADVTLISGNPLGQLMPRKHEPTSYEA